MTTTTVASALESALRPIAYQLDNALAVTEGVAASSLQAAKTLLEQVMLQVLTQYDKEIDEFNSLLDELEKTRTELQTAQLSAGSSRETVRELEIAVAEKTALLDRLEARIKLDTSATALLRKEYNELKSMNPHRLKENLAETRKKLTEAIRLRDDLQRDNQKLRKDVAKLKSHTAELVEATLKLTQECTELRSRLMKTDGDVEPRYFNSQYKEWGVGYYLYVFGFGLDITQSDPDIHIINKELDWHIEVRCTLGVAVIVSVTDWLTPFYPDPTVNPLHAAWPDELNDAVIAKIRDLCANSHPMLVARAEWAELQLLSEIGLPAKQCDLLAASNIQTLFDVVRREPSALTKVKGIGEKTAREIHAFCMQHVREWMRQYDKECRQTAA